MCGNAGAAVIARRIRALSHATVAVAAKEAISASRGVRMKEHRDAILLVALAAVLMLAVVLGLGK